MRALASIAAFICRINSLIGHTFAWLVLGSAVLCFAVVVLRYGFSTTHLWMQDLYVWLNGAMFMALAGYALLIDAHVRVDILYRPASVRRKAWLDMIGVVVFLIPFCVIVWLWGFEFVQRSWKLGEGSSNPGGMVGLWVLKTFILVFAVLVLLQGLAMLIRSVLILSGRDELVPPQMRYDAE